MIDFKELPATAKQGDPDTFEKFCAEFLELMGFEIVGGPSRGADGGIDLKVRDFKRSTSGFVLTETYWLASCKHFAHRGKSVGVDDELNIRDRLEEHGCIGFLGLYTTIASTSLENKLKKFPSLIFYDRKIEREIVGSYSKEVLFARYFPNSYKRWKETYNFLEPVKLFEAFLDSHCRMSDAKTFLKACFGSVDNSIKLIRRYNSFQEIFESEKIQYEVTDLVSKLLNRIHLGDSGFEKELEGYNSLMSSEEQINLETLYNKVVPYMLFQLIGIKNLVQVPLVISFGINYDANQDNNISNYFLFPNYFFCSAKTHESLKKNFQALKDILT